MGELVVYCREWFYNLRFTLTSSGPKKVCAAPLRFLRDRRSDSPREIVRPHETAQPKKKNNAGKSQMGQHVEQDTGTKICFTQGILVRFFLLDQNVKHEIANCFDGNREPTGFTGNLHRGKVDNTCEKRTSNSKTWPARHWSDVKRIPTCGLRLKGSRTLSREDIKLKIVTS